MVVSAIVVHTNLFNSTVWVNAFPDLKQRVQKAYDGLEAADYLVRHQINSGHSFGVFDTEYKYRTASGEAAGGEVKWDQSNTSATAQELDDLIDSPLVSHALSYDGFNALDMEKLGPLLGLLPQYGAIFHRFDITDPRDPENFKPTGLNQVLMRNSTCTRTVAEGKGIMSKLANWLMLYAQQNGYKSINIECFDERVGHVWRNPKNKGMTAEEPTAFHVEDFKSVDENGKIFPLFGNAKHRACRVWVTL